MLGACSRQRAREVARREPVDRHRRHQASRLHADHLPVVCLRGDVVGLRGQQRRPAGGQPRFGLRDVGARHLADIETIPRLPQRRLEHGHVAALQIEDRGVAQQIHVGGHRTQQHRLLGRAQRFARCKYLRLRLPRAVAGLEAVEQRLRGGDAIGCGAHVSAIRRGTAACRAGLGEGLEIGLAQAAGRGHARAVTAERNGDVLVDGAGRGALGVELRIVLVGLDQRRVHRGRAGGGAAAWGGVSCALALASQMPATATMAVRAVTHRPTEPGRPCPLTIHDPTRHAVKAARPSSRDHARTRWTLPTLRNHKRPQPLMKPLRKFCGSQTE